LGERAIKEYLPWSDNFAVGVAELDEDHRRMVAAINAFGAAAADGATRADLLERIDRLIEIAEAHFEREEAVIERIKIGKAMPAAAGAEAIDADYARNHAREHSVRLSHLRSTRERTAQGEAIQPEPSQAEAIALDLVDWFLRQAIGFDARIRGFFVDR
jgi:hemerythrin-like metal-binding protein